MRNLGLGPSPSPGVRDMGARGLTPLGQRFCVSKIALKEKEEEEEEEEEEEDKLILAAGAYLPPRPPKF